MNGVIFDIEAKSFETEGSMFINNKLSRDTKPSSNYTGKMDGESTAKVKAPSAEKNPRQPSQEEIDEFFAVAENKERERFTKKYNFDVVTELPLDGRYEWVRLK